MQFLGNFRFCHLGKYASSQNEKRPHKVRWISFFWFRKSLPCFCCNFYRLLFISAAAEVLILTSSMIQKSQSANQPCWKWRHDVKVPLKTSINFSLPSVHNFASAKVPRFCHFVQSGSKEKVFTGAKTGCTLQRDFEKIHFSMSGRTNELPPLNDFEQDQLNWMSEPKRHCKQTDDPTWQ